MMWEKLEVYIARKELSAKAIKEAADILARGEYSSEDDISKLSAVLLKLNPDVLYNFFTSGSAAITEDLIEKVVKSIDVQNPVKAGHIYIAVIALSKAGYRAQAGSLLMQFIRTNLPKKSDNKSLYDGLRRATKYGADSYLFAKLDGWSDREINLFTMFLSKCAQYFNDSELTEAVEKFCQNNGKNFVPRNQESIEKKVPKSDADNCKTLKSVDKVANELDLDAILKLLEDKITVMQGEVRSKREELRGLKSENLSLKNSNRNLMSQLETSKAQNSDLMEKTRDLESKVKGLTRELEGAKNALESNRAKLNNIESAFGQAGQTEIDALKGNIHKRLSSEYEKYIEIRDKTPDLGYYEILMAVLEDIFRVLKKNGITF